MNAPTPVSSLSAQDQAKFDAILQAHNYVPPAQGSNGSPAQNWRSLVSTPAPQQSSPFGGLSDIGAQAKSGFNKIVSGVNEAKPLGGSGGLGGVVEGVGNIVGGAADIATSPFAPVMKPVGTAVQAAGDALSETPLLKAYGKDTASLPANEPTAPERIAGTIANYANAFGTVAGASGAIEKVPEVMKNISDYLSKPIETSPASIPTEASGGLTDNIRSYFAKDNVDPRLEATAQRLDNPVVQYQDYAKQADASVKDVKADPPIATVGENIGNAYDQVVKMRQTVGKAMADELNNVKDTKIPIQDAVNTFTDKVAAGIGKMTSFDRGLVGTYLQEVKALGANPTASQLDDFLSRVPNELDVAKSAKNITDVTNAERIIKNNLADIRSTMTETPGLQGYGAARNAYANLSNFLEQGGKYLGAKTASGDFARDASVAKSAAESIVNGGKKDWLVKLEGLTGYKALDDATLAIQAMKDAGDPRGLSLFKSLGEGAIHPSTLTFKLLQMAGNAIGKRLLGSDAEQTAAFLKSVSGGKTANVQTPPPTTP